MNECIGFVGQVCLGFRSTSLHDLANTLNHLSICSQLSLSFINSQLHCPPSTLDKPEIALQFFPPIFLDQLSFRPICLSPKINDHQLERNKNKHKRVQLVYFGLFNNYAPFNWCPWNNSGKFEVSHFTP